MSNVIKFVPKNNSSVPIPPGDLEALDRFREEEFVDKYVEQFIVESILTFEDAEKDKLLANDIQTAKMIAFLRETLLATLYLFREKPHDMQDFAYDVVEFAENVDVQEIDLD